MLTWKKNSYLLKFKSYSIAESLSSSSISGCPLVSALKPVIFDCSGKLTGAGPWINFFLIELFKLIQTQNRNKNCIYSGL